MRVDIKGNNPITSDQVKAVIDSLNKEFAPLNLKVKNMTCYIRFIDEQGKTVEPLSDGLEIRKCFTFTESKDVKKYD